MLKYKPIAYDTERVLIQIIKKMISHYAPLSPNELQDIRSEIPSYIHIKEEQIIALRRMMLREYIITNTQRVVSNIRHIEEAFMSGVDILDIAEKIAFPPGHLLRLLMTKRWGHDETSVNHLFKNVTKMTDKKHRIQVLRAIENDDIIITDKDEARYEADAFEKAIEQFLKDKGIKFHTERQLRRKQQRKHGRAILTPDFLLASEQIVNANGKQIAWIDAKNYYGWSGNFVRKQLSQQVEKYRRRWGTGLLIFRYGFSEKMKLKGIVLAHFIDI